MTSARIRTCQKILKDSIDPNERIIKEEYKNITQPGENYCSEIYRIDIILENLQTNVKKPLHAIAKFMKEDCVENLKIFTMYQFEKEIGFYAEVVPTLQEFHEQSGVDKVYDIFPKLLGYQKNKRGTEEKVDEDVVIVLDNLKMLSYSNIDRCIGFDLEGAKLVLKDLASLHALTIALKLKKPEVFQTKVRKHCYPPKFPEGKTMKHICSQAWLDAILNQPKCKPYKEQLQRKLDVEFERMDVYFVRPVKEPYATIVHNDMWTNNTMQISENGKLIKNKFIDFQSYIYGSPFADMIFFIWCSVQIDVVKKHSEELIRHYHHHFINILEDFGCDISPFEYERFLKQLDQDAPHELFHTLYLAAIIYVEKGQNAIDLSSDEFMADSIGKLAAERIEYVIDDFGKRGWIIW